MDKLYGRLLSLTSIKMSAQTEEAKNLEPFLSEALPLMSKLESVTVQVNCDDNFSNDSSTGDCYTVLESEGSVPQSNVQQNTDDKEETRSGESSDIEIADLDEETSSDYEGLMFDKDSDNDRYESVASDYEEDALNSTVTLKEQGEDGSLNGRKRKLCVDCNETFPNTTAFRQHVQSRPYVCELCRKTFNRKCYLNLHRRACIKSMLKSHRNKKPEHSDQQLVSCDICDKSMEKHLLPVHMRTHAHKFFTCSVCSESFASVPRLKQHFVTHTVKKPLVCHVCGKGYTTSVSLADHVRTHATQRPYICNTCGQRFHVSGAFKAHERIHSVPTETTYATTSPSS